MIRVGHLEQVPPMGNVPLAVIGKIEGACPFEIKETPSLCREGAGDG